jgi:nicotinamide-nucleotide amidase
MTEALDKLAADLGRRLKGEGLVLATAESCTGGWIAKVLTDIPGSSGWFDRGYVTYSNRAKEEMLGVSAETLALYGAVSEAVVREMVEGTLIRSGAAIAVAVSGVAGPEGGSEEKPVGTVWFAWSRTGADSVSERFQFAGNREEIRHQSVRVALERLLELLA